MKNTNIILINKSVFITFLLLILSFGVIIGMSSMEKSLTTFILSPKNSQENLCDELLLFFLHPYIQDALTDYYGKPKQYWQDKILSIEKVEIQSRYFLQVEVQVETFEGAHNPPRGKDIIKFRTDEYSTSVHMLSFKHEDI